MRNIHCLFLLTLMCITNIASAQYADDDVTVRDHRKARDPFIVSDSQKAFDTTGVFTSITLPSFNAGSKVLPAINVSDIRIMNAVSDSSLLGYVQTGLFNRWMEAIPDKPFTTYLQSYVDRRYKPVYTTGAPALVWIIQELRINERTFNMAEKSFLHLKAMSYISNGGDSFRLVNELDTILVRGGMDVTHKHGDNIADALQILLEQSLSNDLQTPKTDNPVYTMTAIREKAQQRYNIPALQAATHADGIYLTFKEFINDQPSVSNISYSLDHNSVRFYYTDSNGNKTFVDKFWAVRKNGVLLKQHDNMLIPIEQKQNGLILTSYLSLARRKNSQTLGIMMGGGLIGGAIAGAASGESSGPGFLPFVENIPYIRRKQPLATSVDIETGAFAL